jgi:hypothetical protein
MCDIPVPIANEETVIRALRECHIRKGKLRDNAFRPPPGIDEVSVMRHTHMTSNPCKQKAQEIAGGDPNNRYVGVAAITAESIRSEHSEVTDSREEFCGHAHISYGIAAPVADEPIDPVLLSRLQELKKKAKLLLDPEPETDAWTGEAIEIQPQGHSD